LTSVKIDISEGALYPIFHKLEAKDVLGIGKRVRKYYKVTKEGQLMVTEVTKEINDFMDTLRIIFNYKTLKT
jgi:DNA-binding PadR family transcriptional regulator